MAPIELWDDKRAQLKTAVSDLLSETAPEMILQGSFVSDDFHLSRDLTGSFSDIDLVSPGISLSLIHI